MVWSFDPLEAAPEDLTDEDFPSHYENGAHPDDYRLADEPIVPECIVHAPYTVHHRLLWRVSWRMPRGQYLPLSFLLHTGAPMHMHLTARALERLKAEGVIERDPDLCVPYVRIDDRRIPIKRSPAGYEHANVIGLGLLQHWRLSLHDVDAEPPFRLRDPLWRDRAVRCIAPGSAGSAAPTEDASASADDHTTTGREP